MEAGKVTGRGLVPSIILKHVTGSMENKKMLHERLDRDDTGVIMIGGRTFAWQGMRGGHSTATPASHCPIPHLWMF